MRKAEKMEGTSGLIFLAERVSFIANFLHPLTSYGQLIEESFIKNCDIGSHQNHVDFNQANNILTTLLDWTPKLGGFFQYNISSSVYGLAWCNGNFNNMSCSVCLNNIIMSIRNDCLDKNIVGARYLSYDSCYVRFNMIDFRGKVDTSIGLFWHDNSTVDQAAFKKLKSQLFNNLKHAITTTKKKPNNMFANKYVISSEQYLNITGTAQCSQDLDIEECNSCLVQVIKDLKARCWGNKFCAIIYGSCFIYHIPTAINI